MKTEVTSLLTHGGFNLTKWVVDAEPEDGDADEHDQVDIIDVADMLQEAADDDQLFRLPPHQRCAAHTMNLVANDSENASANSRFNKLQKVLDAQVHDLHIYAPLVDALLLSLKRRFGPKFDDDQHILAAAVHPRFKLTSWTDDEVVRTRAKRLLQDGISQIQLMEVKEAAGETQGDADVDDPDVDLFFPRPCSSTRESVEEVVDTHLHGRGSTLRDLHETVEKLFRKVNTTLPCSAAVERLFSHGSRIFKKNRYRLNDDTFEMQLMLNLNTT
ncbi:hypothetical protein FJT64_025726 [Amphibalanus amphitrite]|uniref:HAT C-terminal dimerisation domain-containing protein n=1 Tax=Amphibalanus amphitrite TaxID=1232801 RepID=A0A6A4WHA0_AMPAM|nr:hypothetical protein FJT64_025726 [Amphibalanus amphitrite]